jgi:hypothetical protein
VAFHLYETDLRDELKGYKLANKKNPLKNLNKLQQLMRFDPRGAFNARNYQFAQEHFWETQGSPTIFVENE